MKSITHQELGTAAQQLTLRAQASLLLFEARHRAPKNEWDEGMIKKPFTLSLLATNGPFRRNLRLTENGQRSDG